MQIPQPFDYHEKHLELLHRNRSHPWYVYRNLIIEDRIRACGITSAGSGRCLELACGSGIISSHLSGNGYNVEASDIYESAVRFLPKEIPFFKYDLLDESFPEDRRCGYDVVILGDVIEHFENPVCALRNARKFLKEGGVLIVTVPALPRLWCSYDELIGHKKRYTRATLGQEIERAGYQMQTIRHFMFLPSMILFFLRTMKLFDYQKDPLDEMNVSGRGMGLVFTGIILGFDHILGKLFPLPFGSSLIAAGRALRNL